jgi:hypothetical protein
VLQFPRGAVDTEIMTSSCCPLMIFDLQLECAMMFVMVG